jgi:hypothetical protein
MAKQIKVCDYVSAIICYEKEQQSPYSICYSKRHQQETTTESSQHVSQY